MKLSTPNSLPHELLSWELLVRLENAARGIVAAVRSQVRRRLPSVAATRAICIAMAVSLGGCSKPEDCWSTELLRLKVGDSIFDIPASMLPAPGSGPGTIIPSYRPRSEAAGKLSTCQDKAHVPLVVDHVMMQPPVSPERRSLSKDEQITGISLVGAEAVGHPMNLRDDLVLNKTSDVDGSLRIYDFRDSNGRDLYVKCAGPYCVYQAYISKSTILIAGFKANRGDLMQITRHISSSYETVVSLRK